MGNTQKKRANGGMMGMDNGYIMQFLKDKLSKLTNDEQ